MVTVVSLSLRNFFGASTRFTTGLLESFPFENLPRRKNITKQHSDPFPSLSSLVLVRISSLSLLHDGENQNSEALKIHQHINVFFVLF